MKKEWKTPEMECLLVEETAGYLRLGEWDDHEQGDQLPGEVGKHAIS